MAIGDLDGDNKDDLAIDFGSEYGIWVRYADGFWEKIHDLSPWEMNQPLLVRSVFDF